MLTEDFVTHPHPDLQHVLVKKDSAVNIHSLDGKVYSFINMEWIVISQSADSYSVEDFLSMLCTPLGAAAYLYK